MPKPTRKQCLDNIEEFVQMYMPIKKYAPPEGVQFKYSEEDQIFDLMGVKISQDDFLKWVASEWLPEYGVMNLEDVLFAVDAIEPKSPWHMSYFKTIIDHWEMRKCVDSQPNKVIEALNAIIPAF